MERPTLETVIEAYTQTKLKPTPCVTLNQESRCACVVGALYASKHQEPEYNDIFRWAKKLWGQSFVSGLANGFDNIYGSWVTNREDYELGRELGLEIRRHYGFPTTIYR